MRSVSPGTGAMRPAAQSAFACSMRSWLEATKFHQMNRRADGRPAERQHPRRRRRRTTASPASTTARWRGGDRLRRRPRRRRRREHRPLGVLGRQRRSGAGGERARRRGTAARRRAPVTPRRTPVPTSSRIVDAAVADRREVVGRGVLERRRRPPRPRRAGRPRSAGRRGGDAAARASSGERSEWATPDPAVIQFTPPGSMRCTAPVESRCTSAPSNR